MSELKLLPCPFCSAPGGAYPTKTFAPEDSDPETWVHLEWAAGCSGASIPGNPTCGARIYWGFRSREEAVAAWNRRATPPALTPEVREVLERVLKICAAQDDLLGAYRIGRRPKEKTLKVLDQKFDILRDASAILSPTPRAGEEKEGDV